MLSLLGVSKRYGDVTALDECTFSVTRGRILGFLGPNGAGKTTAMRAVLGIVRPDAGEVTWEGAPVDDSVRRRTGYMPEQRGLYPKMRVGSELAYLGELHGLSRADARDRAERWLSELGLADRARDTVESLSHGNQQRVQLAAALVHDPEILILDEPFSGLDPLGVDTLAGVLRERAAAGTAVVFSSHQLDLVEAMCEDVAIIDRGRIVATGDLDGIRAAAPHRVVEIELSEADAFRLDDSRIIRREVDGRNLRLLVDRDVTVADILAGLPAADGVGRLVYTTPPLSEIFRSLVS